MTDKSTAPLVSALKVGLQTRFKDIMESDEYNVATMFIPKFKLNYLEPCQRPAMKTLLIKAVQLVNSDASSRRTESVQPEAAASAMIPESTKEDDLYGFMAEQIEDSAATTEAVAEVELYTATASLETTALAAFPRVSVAFCRYNAALPSSAAVERLFSAAGQILTARRCKMSETNFEKSVFKADAIL